MPQSPPPFELDLLRSFVAVLDLGSFTRAAERLDLSQATVSLQMRRLEERTGRRLLQRRSGAGGHVLATPEGEILALTARRMLALAEEARIALAGPGLGGRLRLGTPEDFATWHLPDILGQFTRAHPGVMLEVACDFSANLLDGFAKGLYDLILFKRDPQRQLPTGSGFGVWHEPLVWVTSPRLAALPAPETLPLILAPAPDVYRRRALEALEAAGRSWRIVFASPSLAGLHAAARAGLGWTVLPAGMVPPGLVTLEAASEGLPLLAEAELVLYAAAGPRSPALDRLHRHIVQSLEARRR